MYNRAKFHAHRTKDMESAMKVYQKFLSNYNKTTRNTTRKRS